MNVLSRWNFFFRHFPGQRWVRLSSVRDSTTKITVNILDGYPVHLINSTKQLTDKIIQAKSCPGIDESIIVLSRTALRHVKCCPQQSWVLSEALSVVWYSDYLFTVIKDISSMHGTCMQIKKFLFNKNSKLKNMIFLIIYIKKHYSITLTLYNTSFLKLLHLFFKVRFKFFISFSE